MRALATYFHDEIRRSSLSGVSTRAALKFFFLGFVPAGKKLAGFKPRGKGIHAVKFHFAPVGEKEGERNSYLSADGK